MTDEHRGEDRLVCAWCAADCWLGDDGVDLAGEYAFCSPRCIDNAIACNDGEWEEFEG